MDEDIDVKRFENLFQLIDYVNAVCAAMDRMVAGASGERIDISVDTLKKLSETMRLFGETIVSQIEATTSILDLIENASGKS